MSKTYNVEWTGKPFKQMKILLICTIGCIIGLPIIWMNKLLTGTLGNVAVYCSHLILSLLSISRPLFSQSEMEIFNFSSKKCYQKHVIKKNQCSADRP